MCTAVTFSKKDHYFGRNLDFEYDFGERVVVTPRNYPFHYRYKEASVHHFSMIGMAVVADNYPLYFDATNEYGLSMAGLYFPGNAVYLSYKEDADNITPFEFIPWILSQCKDIYQAKGLLARLNLVNTPFSDKYPLSPLHWIIADKNESLTVEPTVDGINIYDNPIGVLTNNPPFDFHMHNLANFMNLTREEPINRFAPDCMITPYSRGIGAIGLPGDLSSASRFIRAAFVKLNSECDDAETAAVNQFFHILRSAEQQNGCAKVGDLYEKTIYTSCCNTDKGIYYYTTYEHSQITGVCMYNTDLDRKDLSTFPLITTPQLHMQN
ncbi:MAG: choloylglycine hydrolase [Oscillospiraceae bacterium]|nr:choloylglycine hydrolase [Oscillospiraceae bacterium]